MENPLPGFRKESERNTSEIVQAALKCSAFVIRRARELPPEQQTRMLRMVKDLISIEQDRDNLRV
jgi:hypothetical protein